MSRKVRTFAAQLGKKSGRVMRTIPNAKTTMSTRSTVIVKNNNGCVHLYHHCDGYIEGVGEQIREVINAVGKRKKADEILTNPLHLAVELQKKDKGFVFENDVLHWDIEYLYVVDCDTQTVKVFSTSLWDWDDAKYDRQDLWNGNLETAKSDADGIRVRKVAEFQFGCGAREFNQICKEVEDNWLC